MKFAQFIKENKDTIIELYNSGLSFEQISKKFNKPNGGASIWLFFKQNNIPCRKIRYKKRHSYNELFFEKIDTEAKAYFLGLMYADGNVHIPKFSQLMSISLQEGDKKILERFIKEIEFSGNLCFNRLNDLNKNHQNSFRFSITSNKLCDDLIKLGCMPRKSLILKFPTQNQVPENLIRHFIRGYFDGDGCICIKNNKTNLKLHFNLAGTEDFLTSVMKIFTDQLLVSPTKIALIKNTKVFQLNITRNLDIEKIKNYLYQDSNLFLERKREKFYTLLGEKSKTYFTSQYKNISLRISKNYWRINFYDDDGKRKEISGFKTEDEAFNKLQEVKLLLKNKGEKIKC